MHRLVAIALALCATAAMSVEVARSAFTTSDGVRLQVLEAGRAPLAAPVIAIVPGWSMPAEIFRPQAEALAARHRVAVLDPRGQGESEVPKSGYRIDRRADDVAEFVARYGRVVLVGWSLGGLEALHYVSRRGAGALAGLVLVDNSVGEEPAPKPRAGGGGLADDLRRDRAGALERFVRAMYRTPQPEDAILRLRDAAMRMPLEASLALFPSKLPRSHWRETARAFGPPLLYVVTPQYAEQAANLRAARPQTQVEVFERAGHALFADEPERFARLLGAFVEAASR